MEDKKAPVRSARQPVSKRPASTKPKAAPPAKRAPTAKVAKHGTVDADRRVLIEIAAYFRAEKRGFAPGHEVEDWVAAEAEVLGLAAPAPVKKPRARARKPSS